MKKLILVYMTIINFSLNAKTNLNLNDSDKVILKSLEINRKNWNDKTRIRFCENVILISYKNALSIKKSNTKLNFIDSVGKLYISHNKLKSITELDKSKNINNFGIVYHKQFKDTCLFNNYPNLISLELSSLKDDTLKILAENYTINNFQAGQNFDSTILRLKVLDSLIINMDTLKNDLMEKSISAHPTLKKLTIYTFFYYITVSEIDRIIKIIENSNNINTLTLPNSTQFEKNSYLKLVDYCKSRNIKLNLYNKIYLYDNDYIEKMRALINKEENRFKFFRKMFPKWKLFNKIR